MRVRGARIAALTTALVAVPVLVSAGEVRANRRADGTLVFTNDGSKGTASTIRPPSRRSPSQELEPVIDRYSRARGLDPKLVQAVIQAESAYRVGAVSSKGAIGLMQLMPETARELGVDPWNPEENVRGGTLYLRQLLDAFDWDLRLALAGYNAGPGAVKRYGGIPPYRETTSYISRVLGLYHGRPISVTPASGPRVASRSAPTDRASGLQSVRVKRDANGQLVFSTPE